MRTTPHIVRLRCYGWWWQEGVQQDMIEIGECLIRQLVICSLTQSLQNIVTRCNNRDTFQMSELRIF